jgi:hypothetical protein
MPATHFSEITGASFTSMVLMYRTAFGNGGYGLEGRKIGERRATAGLRLEL